jgi:hypothetical protein
MPALCDRLRRPVQIAHGDPDTQLLPFKGGQTGQTLPKPDHNAAKISGFARYQSCFLYIYQLSVPACASRLEFHPHPPQDRVPTRRQREQSVSGSNP